jgi:hypothetical protein
MDPIFPDLQSAVLCEDVRTEVSGSQTLVGVIGAIPAPQVPIGFFKLCLWTRWCGGIGSFTQQSAILNPDDDEPIAESEVGLHVFGDVVRVGHDGAGPVDFHLNVGELPLDPAELLVVGRLVEKREVVDREHDGHAVVEWQVLRHLVGDVPEADPRGAEKGADERPQSPDQDLLVPRSHVDSIEALRRKVALGSLGKEEHRIEAAGRQAEDLLGKVQGEPPQATVDVPQFLEIDDDAGEAVWHGVAMGVTYLRASARQRATRDAGVVVENAVGSPPA